MTDPFSYFPRDSEGRIHGGPFHFIKHHERKKAFELGWRPLVPNDDRSCHHDEYSQLCYWAGDGPMRLP